VAEITHTTHAVNLLIKYSLDSVEVCHSIMCNPWLA